MRVAQYKILSILLLPLIFIVKAQAASFDEETFNKLSPEERISFAVSCLQSREQLLENFSYKLVVKTSNFRANSKKEGVPGWTKEGDLADWRYTFVRSGDKLITQGQEVAWDGKLLQDLVQSWDGNERHGMAKRGNGEKVCIIIDSEEPSEMQSVNYNILLGYRGPKVPMVLVTLAPIIGSGTANFRRSGY